MNIVGTCQWGNSGYPKNNAVGPNVAYPELKEVTASWQGTITPKDYINVFMYEGAEKAYEIPYETDGAKARFITTDEIARIVGKTDFSSVSTPQRGWFYLDGGTSASTGATWQTMIATSTEQSAYHWLYDYTNNCKQYGCKTEQTGPSGYWTSDAVPDTTLFTWIVSCLGNMSTGVGGYSPNETLYGNSGGYLGFDTGNKAGIRPVITVLKSVFN